MIAHCNRQWPFRFIGMLLAILLPLSLAGGSAAAEETAVNAVAAQVSTAFTYQGQLKLSDELFSGSCNFQFGLWDAETEGAQQGDTQSIAGAAVENGLFTVQLDFGNQFTGDARWLEVGVQCADDEGFTTLAPRVLLAATPYAIGLMPGAQTNGAISGSQGVFRAVNTAEGAAIVGLATASSGATYGLLGNAFSPGGSAVLGYADGGAVGVQGYADGGGRGVYGVSPGGTAVEGSSTIGAGVIGKSTDWIGVYGESAKYQGVHGASTIGAGVVGVSRDWVGTYGESASQAGVWGKSTSGSGVLGASTTWAGVYGESTEHIGVWGLAHHPHHAGVLGAHDGGGAGVLGHSPAGDGVHGVTAAANKAGVAGINTGAGNGVYGRSDGGGFAGFFEGSVAGRTVHVLGGADLAEWYRVSGAAEPGLLMVIDPANPGQLMPSSQAYDTRVAGVVSGAGGVNPGLTLQQQGVLDGDTQVAIAGRVYVQAEAFSAPIQPGDLLTTSAIPGHAMKAVDRGLAYGAVIGKAMSSLESGQGLVLVLVNLQ
jgi:hypothetical protein